MNNGDAAAFARPTSEGMTKRELGAFLIFAAMLGGSEANPNGSGISATEALELTDDLLKQLEEK